MGYIQKNTLNSKLKTTNSLSNNHNITDNTNKIDTCQNYNPSDLQSLSTVPSSPSIFYSSLSFLSPQNKQNVLESKINASRQRSESTKSECSPNNSKHTSPSSSNTNHNNPITSLNSKLPPIRHPKTKLIMKNLKNRQIQRQSSVDQSQNNNLNYKQIDLSDNSTNNDMQISEKLDQKLNLNKIVRSSSSSVLEKRLFILSKEAIRFTVKL